MNYDSFKSFQFVLNQRNKIYKKLCFRLYKIQTVELVWPCGKNEQKKAPSNNFGMVPTCKTKKGKTSKFMDAGGYKWNERESERAREREREKLTTWSGQTGRGGEGK